MTSKKRARAGILDPIEVAPWSRLSLWFFIVFLLLIIFILVGIEFDLSKLSGQKTAEKFADLAVQLVAGVLAAGVFAHFYISEENEKLQRLRRVGEPALVEDILQDLGHYEGVYCEDFTLRARLYRHPTKAYLLCTVRHDYKISRLKLPLRAIFNRRTAEVGTIAEFPAIENEVMQNFFVWNNDETQYTDKPDEGDYRIVNVTIGGTKCALSKEVNSTKGGSTIRYTASINELPEDGGMIGVTYDVTFPMENESILSLTAEFPSHRGEFAFDYTALGKEKGFSIYPIANIGLKKNPLEYPSNGTDEIRFKHDSWLLPKDCVVVAWWNS